MVAFQTYYFSVNLETVSKLKSFEALRLKTKLFNIKKNELKALDTIGNYSK